MDKYEVAVLAEDYERKKLRYEMLGMRNIAGLKHEERLQSGVEYHVAQAEMLEALAKLDRAKNAV